MRGELPRSPESTLATGTSAKRLVQLVLCGQAGYVAPVRVVPCFLEPSTDRTPHNLSGSSVRRKRTQLASSFHGVAAGLAIESGVSPRTGWVLPIDSRVEVRRHRRHVPRPHPGDSRP